jgi:hypothetical protein
MKSRTPTGRKMTEIILLRLASSQPDGPGALFLFGSFMFESVVYRGEERPAEGRNDDD